MGNVLCYSDTLIDYTAVVGALMTVIMTISVFRNLYKYPDEMKNASHKRISTAAITCYATAMVAMCCYHVLSNDNTSLEHLIGWEIFAFFWGIANCLSYLLFILRLKTTFQGTAFRTPSWLYTSLYLCVFIFFSANIILLVIYVLKYKGNTNAEILTKLHTGELVAKLFADLYLSIFLTYLFVSKLLQLAMDMFSNQIGNATMVTSDERVSVEIIDMKLTRNEHNLLRVANKMTVLSTTTALSTEFVICVAALSSEMGDDFLNGFLWYFAVMFCLIIDSMVNAFCIYVSLPYSSSKQLYKCCRFCDECCMYCVMRRLEKRKLKTSLDGYVSMQEMQL